MDTSHLENIAEEYISSILQKSGLLVAKPKFDIRGTDLILFRDMKDGIKFCRVQCKGRSFVTSSKQSVRIYKDYVSNVFVFILYLLLSQTRQDIYIFFPTDIERWNLNNRNEYEISLYKTNVEYKLSSYRFNDKKIAVIDTIIEQAELSNEFQRVVYGSGAATLPKLICNAIGSQTNNY